MVALYIELNEHEKTEGIEHLEDENLDLYGKDLYWHLNQHRLENSLVLILQGIELFLKGRIAEESPFLLLSESSKWNFNADFLDQVTLNSKDLIDKCNAVKGQKYISDDFRNRFHKIRMKRNRIIHMGLLSDKIKPEELILEIIFFYSGMGFDNHWIDNRISYCYKVAPKPPEWGQYDHNFASHFREMLVEWFVTIGSELLGLVLIKNIAPRDPDTPPEPDTPASKSKRKSSKLIEQK